VSLARAIEAATARREVDSADLEAAFATIMDGAATPVQIAALLVALRTKGETVGEIVAAARALRARAHTALAHDERTVDTCGTGGSGEAKTFNVSTTAAFVVAGAGVPVAKHGNRAATSRSGSFDLLEALGVEIDLSVEESARVLREIGIGVFFARAAHPAMRHVAAVRQELGIRTLMNGLGPLLNPVGARYQVVGVYDTSMVRPMAEALGRLGCARALVVHGCDGLDELTTRGPSAAALLDDGKVSVFSVEPGELGFARPAEGALAGGDAARNAEIARAVLAGERGAARDIVVLNAAAAIWIAHGARDLSEGVERAAASIDSGAASTKLAALVAATHAARSGAASARAGNAR